MLTYTFTNIGSDSLYQHLYKCIKNDILQGKLGTGERLPSKRPFAKNLGISVITVDSVLNTYVMNYSSINLDNLNQIAESLYQIFK